MSSMEMDASLRREYISPGDLLGDYKCSLGHACVCVCMHACVCKCAEGFVNYSCNAFDSHSIQNTACILCLSIVFLQDVFKTVCVRVSA